MVDAGRIPDSATTLQTLKLVVSDFSQLVMTFGQVYETELQKYCERLAPRLSPCGPLFQAVHNDLALCLQVRLGSGRELWPGRSSGLEPLNLSPCSGVAESVRCVLKLQVALGSWKGKWGSSVQVWLGWAG